MGDINFAHTATVDLTKTIVFDIDKFIDANVNNPDQVATALSDAEAIGRYALAETNTYTYVDEGNAFSYSEAVSALDLEEPCFETVTTCIGDLDGQIDVLGNSVPYTLGPDDNGDGVADTISISFNSDGTPPPDVDDINGAGELAVVSSPPPATPDAPIPDPLLTITDLNLTQTGEVIDIPGGIEAAYASTGDWVVNFGERTIDLLAEEEAGGFLDDPECDVILPNPREVTGELTLTVEAGTVFLAEFLDSGGIELEFATGGAFFELGGETYNATGFVFESETLGVFADYSFEATVGEPGFGSMVTEQVPCDLV